MEILRKKLKSYSYTTNGVDYVKLFRIFDNDRTGRISFHRWLQVIRKTCKFPRHLLGDGDVLEIFQTVAGENGGVNAAGAPDESGFIDQEHLLKFIKTDVPSALSLSKENHGKVSQAEVLMYVIEKAKSRLRECALNAKVTDWDTMFKLYDSDGNGILSYDEVSEHELRSDEQNLHLY